MNAKRLRIQWVDQITADPQKTAGFYADLLGFGQVPVPEPNDRVSYCLTDERGVERIGIVDEINFPNWASGWVLYFEVEDFEGQCGRVVALGGEIVLLGVNQCLVRDPSGAPVVLCRAGVWAAAGEGDF